MDRIILGDNQFFGINHMSEEKARSQAERFTTNEPILDVINTAYDLGIHAFMFNTHDRVAQICDCFRAHPERYPELRLYVSLPYAHKYANAVNEKGIVGALSDFLFSNRTLRDTLGTVVAGGARLIDRNPIEMMKTLVDAEMRMFRGLDVRAVFLQNIVTDLVLGCGAHDLFVAFHEHIWDKHNAEAAFNTLNMPRLVEVLLSEGIANPVVCSAINKAGYLMHPSREAYETALETMTFRPLAMSILASGAVPPVDAVDYVTSLGRIEGVVFGASSGQHIAETRDLLNDAFEARSVESLS